MADAQQTTKSMPEGEALQRRLSELESKIRTLQQDQAVLSESEEKFRSVLENISEGYYEVDLAGNFTFCNEAFSRFLGMSPERLIGTHFKSYAEAETTQDVYRAFSAVYQSGISGKIFDIQVIRQDGSRRSLEFSISLLKDKADRPLGFCGIARDSTERYQAEEALKESEVKYRTLVENANEAIFVAQDGYLKFFNSKTVDVIGYPQEEIGSLPFIQFIHPEDRALVVERHQKRVRGEELPRIYPFRILTGSGQPRWVRINSVLIEWERRPATLNFLIDISDQREIEAALQDSENRYRTIFENTGTTMAMIEEDTTISLVNSQFEKLTGYAKEEIEGKRSWTDFTLYDDLEKMKAYHRQRREEPQAPPGQYEFRLITKQNQIRHVALTIALLPDGKRSVASLQDISELKAVEEKLRELSLLDELTGLFNRRGFFTLAEQEVKVANRMNKGVFLIFVDLDDLKGINDSFGHQQGDQALIAVARILKSTFRDLDILARVGGDEFVILALDGVSDQSEEILMERLSRSVTAHNNLKLLPFPVLLSTGVAFHAPGTPPSVDTLLTEADQKMYDQKRKKTR